MTRITLFTSGSSDKRRILSDDPDVNNVIRFLREREIVHVQRFGECLRLCKEKMDSKNVYLTNPAFDKRPVPQPRAIG